MVLQVRGAGGSCSSRGRGRLWAHCSTALAVSCYWACVVGYTVFLLIPIYDSELDDFEVKVRALVCTLHMRHVAFTPYRAHACCLWKMG